MGLCLCQKTMKSTLRIMLCLLLGTVAGHTVGQAQYVRLNAPANRNALYFDLTRVLNYNSYEYWRFGAGLYWVSPAMLLGPQWQVHAYGAYGLRDRRAKYGIEVARSYRGNHFWRPFVGFSDDLAKNNSAVIDNAFSLLNIEDNVAIMSSQFVRQQESRLGVSARWNLFQTMLEFRYMRQRLLFDGDHLLYPAQESVMPDWSHLAELHLQANRRGVTADLRSGTAADAPGWWYLRSLLQYSRSHPIDSIGTLGVFLQTGAATGASTGDLTTLHRLFECFDLGGTYNSFFCFRNSLLTLPPECFMADRFVRGSLRYEFPVCGWDRWFSAPEPFVQATAALGRHYTVHDWSAVGEAAAGFTGLLRWNIIDMGCAVAYQLLNTSSGDISLRPDSLHKRWAFVVCAQLVI